MLIIDISTLFKYQCLLVHFATVSVVTQQVLWVTIFAIIGTIIAVFGSAVSFTNPLASFKWGSEPVYLWVASHPQYVHCTCKQGTFLQSLGSQVWLNVLDFTGFTTFMIFATISRLSRFTNFTRLTCFIVSLVSQSSLLWLIFTTFTGLNS